MSMSFLEVVGAIAIVVWVAKLTNAVIKNILEG